MRAEIIADLHISDVFNGQHVDYLQNCIDCLGMITNHIRDSKLTHLFLLGDIIGQNEKNLKQRSTLLILMRTLQEWNNMTRNNYLEELYKRLQEGKISEEFYRKEKETNTGNVYSVKGNHDMGNSITDFEMFVNLGLIKVEDTVDVDYVRFHLVNYGEERRTLLIDESKNNIALVHNNIMVEGITTWYRGGHGIEMSTLTNFKGVELIVAGHIHDPSIKIVYGNIEDTDVALFYPGNITRPRYEANIWEKAFGIYISTEDVEGLTLEQKVFNLKPSSELFRKTFDDISEEEIEQMPSINVEELSAILKELQTYSFIGNVDYKNQIVRLGGLDKEASDLALKYIEEAENIPC